MAKDVKFNIRLTIDGKEQVVTASTNVKALAKELGIAADQSTRFRDTLLRINQATQSFQNVFSGLQQLTGVMQEYTRANAVQQEAEVKLATVMRQRMQATEGDIDSIKKLCAAQQELGIIGDEVQLMGAQQIATFVQNRQALETLIPAMNNLVAQQRGFNATGSDAVSVGNLIGKAMQGQVSALSRVGISFDAAQEYVLKYGNETERAATIAEVITQNVGNMNAELRNTDAGQAKALANAFGDMKERIGAMVAPFESTLMYVGQLSFALNSIGTTMGGIWGVIKSVKALAVALNIAKVQTVAATIATKYHAAETAVLGTVSAATGVSVRILTFALRGLLIATGVGAVIVALGYAINALIGSSKNAADGLDEMSDAERQAQAASEAERAEVERNTAMMHQHIAMCKNFKGTKEEEKKVVDMLNNTYGSTMGYFSSVSAWYNTLIANSKAYAQQMINEARARQIANQIAKLDTQIYNLGYDEKGNPRDFSKDDDKKWVVDGGATTSWGSSQTYGHYETVAGSGLRKYLKAQLDLRTQREALVSQLNDLVSNPVEMPVHGSPTPPSGTTTSAHTGSHTGGHTGSATTTVDNAPKLTEEAITYKQLSDNVAYYQNMLENANITEKEAYEELVKKKTAAEAAVEAYNRMVEGIADLQKYDKDASSIEDMQVNVEVLRRQLSRTAPNSKEWQKVTDAINGWQDKLDGIEKGSMSSMERTISRIDEELKNRNLDMDAEVKLSTTRYNLQKQLDERSKEVAFKVEIEGREGNMGEIDRAIQFYTDRQQSEDADNVRKTQDIIDRLTKKRSVFELSVDLAEKSKEVKEIEELTAKERILKIRGIGFEELTSRIKDIDKKLADSNITDKQREELQKLSKTYKEWRKQSVSAFDSVKEGWSGIKGLGNGIKSMTDALQGNGDAWSKVTSIIDGFISIYESVSAVVGIINMLTEAAKAHATAKAVEATTTVIAAGAEEASADAGVAGAAAAKEETAAYMELASAKFFAAHASIPFGGFAIGAGFTAAAKAIVTAMGATAFAEGGMVFGPTLALFGEYPGAQRNPEVVAPLDRLATFLKPSDGIGGKVKFEIQGRKLRGVLKKEERHNQRM